LPSSVFVLGSFVENRTSDFDFGDPCIMVALSFMQSRLGFGHGHFSPLALLRLHSELALALRSASRSNSRALLEPPFRIWPPPLVSLRAV
jgi:hypothetical protein